MGFLAQKITMHTMPCHFITKKKNESEKCRINCQYKLRRDIFVAKQKKMFRSEYSIMSHIYRVLR